MLFAERQFYSMHQRGCKIMGDHKTGNQVHVYCNELKGRNKRYVNLLCATIMGEGGAFI